MSKYFLTLNIEPDIKADSDRNYSTPIETKFCLLGIFFLQVQEFFSPVGLTDFYLKLESSFIQGAIFMISDQVTVAATQLFVLHIGM